MEQLFQKWLDLLDKITSDPKTLGYFIGTAILLVLLISGQWIILIAALVLFYLLKRYDPDMFGVSGGVQKKFSLDIITKNKIVKGALMALAGSAAIGLLEYFGTLQVSNPMLAGFIVWAVPVLTNAINEWRKGV